MVVGELRRHRLAHDERAGASGKSHTASVPGRPVAAVDGRAVFGRLIGRIDDVLDPDRHTVQWAASGTAIQCAGNGPNLVRVDMVPGED